MTETPKHREQLGDWMVEQGLTGRMIEWAKEQGQTVQLTECSSWWVRKA